MRKGKTTMKKGSRRSKLASVPVAPVRGVSGDRALSIRSLKDLVMSRFPEEHPLRAVILAERDLLSPQEFVVKLEIWSVLLNRRA